MVLRKLSVMNEDEDFDEREERKRREKERRNNRRSKRPVEDSPEEQFQT